jgi:hypothetical protein
MSDALMKRLAPMTHDRMTIASEEELFTLLNNLMPRGRRVCIGVDGLDGIGKSTLARAMAKRLGGSVISLDDYLNKKQNRYVQHIRCNEVDAAIATSPSPILIEGVCLLAVARRCDFDLDMLVYVRRLSRNTGIWHDQEWCMAERPAAELKKEEQELRNIFAEEADDLAEKDLGLRGELIDYHAEWKPVHRADLVFDVVRDD